MIEVKKHLTKKNALIAALVASLLGGGAAYEFGPSAMKAVSKPSVTTVEAALATKGTNAVQRTEFTVAGGKEDAKWTNISCLLNSKANFREDGNITVAVMKSAGWTLAELQGKKIVVEGPVTDYKGKPEVKVDRHDQITIEQ